MPSNFKALAAASGGEPTDANFKNVTLLLHGDGSNGAQNNTFIDSSTNNFTITRNGNTTQGSFSPYGSNWSNYFDGNGDYLETPSNAAFDLGGGDFTVEGWFYWNGTGAYPHFFQFGSSVSTRWNVYRDGGSSGYFRLFATTGVTTTTAVPSNTWFHLAVTKSGTTTRLFLNGTQIGSNTGVSYPSGNMSVAIGTQQYAPLTDDFFAGYISNFRVVKGTALYTSTFTPSTTPLTAITNTSLLTCADNRFRDGSTNNFTITRNGDVKVTNFAPFAPSSAYSTTTNGGSAYFDGTGDYLTAAANTAFDVGTGDFTIEFWANWSAVSSTTPGNVCHCVNNGTLGIYITSTEIQLARYNTGGDLTATVTQTVGQWDHYAITRQSGTARIFKNGALLASGSVTTNYGQNGFQIGTGGSSAVNGYISNFRFVKGTAVYTAAFTPPTSPVTAISGTSLLLNATNAAIFDNSMKNDLETVGNAQISTSVKKFGTGSIYLDGLDDHLKVGTSEFLALGSGNFTVECWIYPTTVSNSQNIIMDWRSANNDNLVWYLENAKNVWRINQTSQLYAGTISANSWTHMAVVRNNGTTTLYINGTSTSSFSDSNNYLIQDLKIGKAWDSNYWNGYLDEIRISRGVARYTANFTAPTAPFPNK